MSQDPDIRARRPERVQPLDAWRGELQLDGLKKVTLPQADSRDRTLAQNLACLKALQGESVPLLQTILHPDPAQPVSSQPDAIAANLRSRVRPVVKVFNLGSAGLTAENVLTLKTSEAAAFRRFALHNKRMWNQLRQAGHSAPIESLEYLLSLVNRPGATLVEVSAMRGDSGPKERIHSSDVLSCGLIINDPKAPATRGLALFNTQAVTSYVFPEGFLIDLVLDKAITLSGGKPILTKIVEEPEKYAYRWSQRALEKRGFHPTEQVEREVVTLPPIVGVRAEAETFELASRYYMYEPGHVTAKQIAAKERKEEQRRWVHERIAAGVHCPPAYARVGFWSVNKGDSEAHLFAQQQSQNSVLAFELQPDNVHFHQDNIEYREGNYDGAGLPPQSLDATFLLNILPEIARNGDARTAEENVLRFLGNQIAQLREGGKLILRDFVVPDWPQQVVIEISTDDGVKGGEPSQLSSADFFRMYVKKAYDEQGIAAEELTASGPGKARFIISRGEALKFAWLNGYRRIDDVSDCLNSPLGLMTQESYIRLGRSALNCRVLTSRPIYTPWVQENLIPEKSIMFYDLNGTMLPRPANQFEMVLQKSPADEGVAVTEVSARTMKNPLYLTRDYYQRRTAAGTEVRELISRDNAKVYDLFPYYILGGQAWLIGKEHYPRGIPQAMFNKTFSDGAPRDFSLSGTVSSGYPRESIALVARKGKDVGSEIRRGFLERAHLRPEDLQPLRTLRTLPRHMTLPGPSAINERRWQVALQVPPSAHVHVPERNYSGLSTSGVIRPFHVGELLASSASGPPLSVALSNMAYEICMKHGLPIPPWGGEPITLRDQSQHGIKISRAEDIFGPQTPAPTKERWKRIAGPPSGYDPYLEIWSGRFGEITAQGKPVLGEDKNPQEIRLEYATPDPRTRMTCNVLPVCPCVRVGDRILIGFQRTGDLPLSQIALKQPSLPAFPFFRIPVDIYPRRMEGAETYVRKEFEKRTGVSCRELAAMGTELQVSSGIVPDRIYPQLVELDAAEAARSDFEFCDLRDVLQHRDKIACAYTLSTLLRVAHALGAYDMK